MNADVSVHQQALYHQVLRYLNLKKTGSPSKVQILACRTHISFWSCGL